MKTIDKSPDVVRAEKSIDKKLRKGSIEAARACQGLWAGLDEEVTQLLAQVADLRENEIIQNQSLR